MIRKEEPGHQSGEPRYGELLDLYDKKMASFAEGEIVRGRVVN